MSNFTSESFRVHSNEHPEIYEAFRKFALKAMSVRSNYSARAIFHALRWETMIDSGEEFKINDGWSPFYADKFMSESPRFEGFFRTRTRSYRGEE